MNYDYETIMQNVQQIRKAIYGEEVRGSIADSIEMMAGETKDIESFKQEILDKIEEINKVNANAEIQEARQGFDTLADNLTNIVENINSLRSSKQNRFMVLVQANETDRPHVTTIPTYNYNYSIQKVVPAKQLPQLSYGERKPNPFAKVQILGGKQTTDISDNVRMEVHI